MISLELAVKGMLDAEQKLTQDIHSPAIISENMYRLGQYTSIVEKHLGELESNYEVNWAAFYRAKRAGAKSDAAAEREVNLEMAEEKGQLKKLARYISSSWKIHTGAMARINHLQAEMRGSV